MCIAFIDAKKHAVLWLASFLDKDLDMSKET